MRLTRRSVCLYGLATALSSAAGSSFAQTAASTELTPEELGETARQLFSRNPLIRREAILKIKERGDPDMTAVLIQALRFFRDSGEIGNALGALTGEKFGNDWHAWMLVAADPPGD